MATNKPSSHLTMIQGVINRLAMQSFAVKQWSFTLVVGLLALSFHLKNWTVPLAGTAPVIVLWGLDGYFLRHERLFRHLYDKVRRDEEDEPFSMETDKSAKSWWGATFSRTLTCLYLLLIALLVGAALLICQTT
ncbi:hypothetical protein [Candidatus Palauibacter sp.]|uniref:hypothetical protein n=1 Tax=Candidatus Palauibacter sp. TaxID=3101350 RepID=UPI003C6EEF06